MTDHQTDAVTLFAAHTHAVDAFDVVAYLFITSAVRRSGKSLLEELLEHLCLRGRSTTNISPAAVYRMVDEVKPTLLFDEVDNIFAKGRNGDPAKTDLIGPINAGYRRGKPAWRMGGANMRTLERSTRSARRYSRDRRMPARHDRGPLHQDPPRAQRSHPPSGALPDTAPRGASPSSGNASARSARACCVLVSSPVTATAARWRAAR